MFVPVVYTSYQVFFSTALIRLGRKKLKVGARIINRINYTDIKDSNLHIITELLEIINRVKKLCIVVGNMS